MYEARFGLKRRPFPSLPDTALYYPASSHEAALAASLRGVADQEGLILVTGNPGTGKTLLAHLLLDRLGADTQTAFLTNSHFADRSALLQAILFDLGLPYSPGSEQMLRLRLTDYLLKQWSAGKPTVLILDEAHLLSLDLLEEVRLLSNLEAGQGKAFQAILLGLPEILATVRHPLMATFEQRLAVRAQLSPLVVEEALDYVLHHLRLAGGNAEKIIDETALDVIARAARGLPRLLNQAAHQALMLADAAELAQVDAEAALEALSLLGLQEAGAEREEVHPPDENESQLMDDGRPILGLLPTEPEQARRAM